MDIPRKMINDIFKQPPSLDENSEAFKSWQKSEPLSIDVIIQKSSMRIKLESDFKIETKVKDSGPYTKSGRYIGTYTGQVLKTDGPKNDDWSPHGFGRLVFDMPGEEKDEMRQAIYEGYFNEGYLTGYAKHIYGDGERYEGNYRLGERGGQGEFHFKSGNTYKGDWL